MKHLKLFSILGSASVVIIISILISHQASAFLPLTPSTIIMANITSTPQIFTTRTIDLSNSAYNTVIDNDTADTIINATSKPSIPQFVQTISAGNIPTDTTDVKDYTVVLTVGGKNINATTAKAISMIPTRNGVEVDTTRSVTVTNGNFWESGYYLSGSALTAGDKIGLKMWCSSSPCSSGGGLDYRYATIYIIPRQFVSTNNGEYSIFPQGNTLTLTGSVGGVTYSIGTPNLGTNTVGTVIDPILGTTIANAVSPALGDNLISIKGQNLSELGTNGVVASLRATTDVGTTPAQQAASNLLSVNFAKFVRITTLS